MNNEPVAWIKQNPETLEAELHFDKPAKYWATVVSNPDIPLYTHPVKELTDDDRSMLIRTLKWAEDLLREAGHDEAVSDAQDCLMILRKAQKT